MNKKKIIIIAAVVLVLVCGIVTIIGFVGKNNINGKTTESTSIKDTKITEVSATEKTTIESTVDESSDTSTKIVTEKTTEKNSKLLFDKTYWNLEFGQTMGTSYEAQFYSDGTLLAVSRGSRLFSKGTYKYCDGILIIKFDSFVNISFAPCDDGFQSVGKYPMQVGDGYYNIAPSSGEFFKECYSSGYTNQITKDNAENEIRTLLSKVFEISENVLDTTIDKAENKYGKATYLYSEAGWTMYVFNEAPIKFKVEYSDGEIGGIPESIMYIDINDLGLSSLEKERLQKACAIVYKDTDYITIMLETNNEGVKRPHKLCFYGLENGKVLDDAPFSLS